MVTGGCETECFRPACTEMVYRESATINKGRLFCGDVCQKQCDADKEARTDTYEQGADLIKPDYYQPDSVYEPFKIIRHYGLNFFEGNVLKYLLRAGKKNTATRLEDLQKAATYLASEIEETKKNQEQKTNDK